MDWNEWKNYYKIIIKKLKIDPVSDETSARLLDNILTKRTDKERIETKLRKMIYGSNVIVYGCGPSLSPHVKEIKDISSKFINIAADGAVSALLQNDIFCHINVTDLDGYIKDIILANSSGTLTIVHAHGDNIPLIKKYLPEFNGTVLGSAQVEPFGNLVNYFGFTDGDRCIFLAFKFHCKKIVLIGFDFGSIVGEYSKPGLGKHAAGQRKMIKLNFAKFLISKLYKKYKKEIFTLSRSDDVEGLRYISITELKDIVKY